MENRPVSDEVADRSIKLEVSLPSGRCETVVVSQVGTVADLKLAAQRSFGQGFLRLIARDGRLLDPTYPLPLSGLQDGDSLIAVASRPKIAATKSAFALWCLGGDRVVTWAIHTMVVTAPESIIDCRMFKRFVEQAMLLLPFWQMEVWSPGVKQAVVVTAPKSGIS
jgi:hypothetical protein